MEVYSLRSWELKWTKLLLCIFLFLFKAIVQHEVLNFLLLLPLLLHFNYSRTLFIEFECKITAS